MSGRLRLDVAAATGALQRVLVTLARRGYEPVRVDARREGDAFHVELEVEGPRSAEQLRPHLARLFDVRIVEVVSGGE